MAYRRASNSPSTRASCRRISGEIDARSTSSAGSRATSERSRRRTTRARRARPLERAGDSRAHPRRDRRGLVPLSDGPTIRDCRECGMPFSPPVYPQRFCPDCKLKRDARDLMKKGIRDPMPSFDAPAGRVCEHPDCGDDPQPLQPALHVPPAPRGGSPPGRRAGVAPRREVAQRGPRLRRRPRQADRPRRLLVQARSGHSVHPRLPYARGWGIRPGNATSPLERALATAKPYRSQTSLVPSEHSAVPRNVGEE
jgi:hypothetical protein